MDGALSVAGFPKPAAECPPDLLETEPALPRMNLITPRKDLYPVIPDAITKDRLPLACILDMTSVSFQKYVLTLIHSPLSATHLPILDPWMPFYKVFNMFLE